MTTSHISLQEIKTRVSVQEIALIVFDIPNSILAASEFTQYFPALFERHFNRPFEVHDSYDLMLSEMTFTTAFGWLGDGGKVYR